MTGEIPGTMVAHWVRMSPGHGREYTDAVTSDWLPAVKKSGLKPFSLWQVWFGSQQSQYLSLIGIDNWAFFDRPDPIAAAMGNEAYQRYGAKIRPAMVEASEEVYRFRPELSYLPAKK